jgi:hypothetical protein
MPGISANASATLTTAAAVPAISGRVASSSPASSELAVNVMAANGSPAARITTTGPTPSYSEPYTSSRNAGPTAAIPAASGSTARSTSRVVRPKPSRMSCDRPAPRMRANIGVAITVTRSGSTVTAPTTANAIEYSAISASDE